MHRITLDVSQQVVDRIDHLAGVLGLDRRQDVVAQSLILYNQVVSAREAGLVVLIMGEDKARALKTLGLVEELEGLGI